jgi:hypothetical protein
MTWTKPEAEVVAVTMEVTAYVATLYGALLIRGARESGPLSLFSPPATPCTSFFSAPPPAGGSPSGIAGAPPAASAGLLRTQRGRAPNRRRR